MVIGFDNTNVNTGSDSGLGTLMLEISPFLHANGCFAHYKYFSKRSKKLLDLQRWFSIFSDRVPKYESLFLTFVLSDILSLCSKFAKEFQKDDYYLCSIQETIEDLTKCLDDAYLNNPERKI